ncbi:MAG TPA: GIY-YIG nuclease family protein [Chitinivibrionales bacterium]|nr:GIY-YIG nuclease family protein [Chitinivibrionales bacterium]
MTDKKELIRNYKQTLLPMGIFQVTNTANGKILVGKSKTLNTKFNSIMFQLKTGSFPNPDLQSDFVKCGEGAFKYEIIDRLEPKEDPLYNYDDDLKTLEELWLDKLKPFGEKGYNRISRTGL